MLAAWLGRELTCRDPMETHGEREIGLWISLFALSKAFEFFDTAFIILRKKPLIFLHCQSPALIKRDNTSVFGLTD